MMTRAIACAALLALGVGAAVPAKASAAALFPVSEVRLGVLAHDVGPFSSRKEDGADINIELLFNDLGWFKRFGVRPHIGGSINTSNDTSQGYFGLTGTVPIGKRLFFEMSVGGAVHNGNKNENEIGRKDLGCRVLFRESVAGGIYLGKHATLSVMLDHISDANLCEKNEGLESVGVRYGFRF
jgi:hypothetical protein